MITEELLQKLVASAAGPNVQSVEITWTEQGAEKVPYPNVKITNKERDARAERSNVLTSLINNPMKGISMVYADGLLEVYSGPKTLRLKTQGTPDAGTQDALMFQFLSDAASFYVANLNNPEKPAVPLIPQLQKVVDETKNKNQDVKETKK